MTDKPRVLLVDDNVNLLDAIKRVLRKQVDLVTAEGAGEALKILESEPPFAVLVSDQNMPNMKGDALLAEAAKRWPMTVRVMLTGNDDQMTAIAAVNAGQVFRFVRKPCEPDMLTEIITAASAHHKLITAEKDLLENTLSGSVKVLSDVLAALRPDLYQKATKVRKGAKLVAARMNLTNAWELDLAAMLYPLGMAAIPDLITQKHARGEQLAADEQKMIDQSSQIAGNLINNIPRLENVARGIALCRKGFDGSGVPAGLGGGDSIPLIARILRILIDLVDATATSRATLDTAAKFLKGQSQFYDPKLLDVVIDIIKTSVNTLQPKTGAGDIIKSIQLTEGDVVIQDVLDAQGRILVPAGSELTTVMIQRLKNLQMNSGIGNKIMVSRN